MSDDEDAYAVYYASFSENHPDEVRAVVSVGIWWEGGTPEDRVAFPMIIWQNDSEYGVSLLDAAQSPWKDVEHLGRMLDRSEALAHPRVSDVFHITDHIVVEDPAIVEFFTNRSLPSGA